jgi:hypothetical protein
MKAEDLSMPAGPVNSVGRLARAGRDEPTYLIKDIWPRDTHVPLEAIFLRKANWLCAPLI